MLLIDHLDEACDIAEREYTAAAHEALAEGRRLGLALSLIHI
jgi:hypothetical protein